MVRPVERLREEALAMGDSVAIIDGGQVVAHGDPLSLLGRPPRERVARLIASGVLTIEDFIDKIFDQETLEALQ